MNSFVTGCLQAAIILIGVGAFVFLLVEPQFEGRNADATQFEIYFHDPFLAGAYAASSLFYVMLYQAFAVLGRARKREVLGSETVRSLTIIQRCAVLLVGLIGGAVGYLWVAVRGQDDIAGGVAIGGFLMLVFAGVAVVAAVSKRSVARSREARV